MQREKRSKLKTENKEKYDKTKCIIYLYIYVL